jgi:hypothetical protein
MPFGILSTSYVDVPSVVDESYITGMETASGESFTDLIQAIDERFGAFNSGFDPLVAALAYETQEAFVEYTRATAFQFNEVGQYTMNRPQRGDTGGGWMLPVRKWDANLGWTEDGLAEMRSSTILNQVDGLLLGLRTKFKREVLRRFFSDGEVPVEPGKTTAVSPGMAGSGTGLNVYTLPFPNGDALPGGYTHYVRSDSAGLQAALIAARDKLILQGHEAPFDIIAPQSLIDTIKLMTSFVPTGSPLIRAAPDAAEALVDSTQYVGVVADLLRVRVAIADFTSPNLAVFKSYGALDPRNPVAIRFPDRPGLPGGGREAYIRSRELSPLAQAQVISRWGTGIGNRTGAVLIRVDAAGGYVAPTIAQ